jgi:hypothetical protein
VGGAAYPPVRSGLVDGSAAVSGGFLGLLERCELTALRGLAEG